MQGKNYSLLFIFFILTVITFSLVDDDIGNDWQYVSPGIKSDKLSSASDKDFSVSPIDDFSQILDEDFIDKSAVVLKKKFSKLKIDNVESIIFEDLNLEKKLQKLQITSNFIIQLEKPVFFLDGKITGEIYFEKNQQKIGLRPLIYKVKIKRVDRSGIKITWRDLFDRDRLINLVRTKYSKYFLAEVVNVTFKELLLEINQVEYIEPIYVEESLSTNGVIEYIG